MHAPVFATLQEKQNVHGYIESKKMSIKSVHPHTPTAAGGEHDNETPRDQPREDGGPIRVQVAVQRYYSTIAVLVKKMMPSLSCPWWLVYEGQGSL